MLFLVQWEAVVLFLVVFQRALGQDLDWRTSTLKLAVKSEQGKSIPRLAVLLCHTTCRRSYSKSESASLKIFLFASLSSIQSSAPEFVREVT